ncbi:Hemolysin activation/secretion protein [Alteromonadaceae bacterium Bs31]|nr:Hemolysin activation/secretion protein [Alteromonadaceae bacterium Bs31]
MKRLLIAVLLLCLPPLSIAGFLEMPETEEVPELEEETMLLDLDVPSVRERDPDPQGGPRLNVQEFRVQGIVEFPDLGITREELIRRVEDIRFDIMQEGELLDSGYTLDELGEVSDLLGDIEADTEGEHVTPVEVQRLVFLIRDQRRKRGVTLGMIEAVADVITRYYREHGFILAKAYIPEQRVRDGVVTLTLLLGELGEVEVHDNKRYSDKKIQRTFKGAMGKPVTAKSIEERLHLVNDYPGLSVRGYFEPGSQVGDTRLNINTVGEERFDANVRFDNHGTDSGGENRIYADAYLYNPTHTGDQLQIGVLASFDPANTLYGLIRYQTQILHPRLTLFAGASTNDFALDQFIQEGLEQHIAGKSEVADMGMTWKMKRSRVSNHSIDLSVEQVVTSFELSFPGSQGQGLDSANTVQNAKLAYNFDVLLEKRRALHQGSLGLTSTAVTDREGNLGDLGDKEGGIFNFNYAYLKFFRVPFTKSESRLLARSSGQYAGTTLASAVQIGLGGPTRARGFSVNKFYADDAVYLGVDWIFNGPGGDKTTFFGERLRNVLQPYVFIDGAYGYKHPQFEDASDAISARLANAGVGLKFNYKSIRSNLIVATSFKDEITTGSEAAAEDEGSKIYFDLQYSF